MKKICFLLGAVFLWFALATNTLAEAKIVQVNERFIGKGATAFIVVVQLSSTKDEATYYHISTDETTLLAAVLGVELVAGEETAWSFNVTAVAGIHADYDGKGEFWEILAYDDDEGFISWETPVADTPVTGESVFLFYLNQ